MIFTSKIKKKLLFNGSSVAPVGISTIGGTREVEALLFHLTKTDQYYVLRDADNHLLHQLVTASNLTFFKSTYLDRELKFQASTQPTRFKAKISST